MFNQNKDMQLFKINMFENVTCRFDYSKLTYVQHIKQDYQRIKHAKSTLNYLTYVWTTVKTQIKLLGPLILHWIDEYHVDLKQKFIGSISSTDESWDDIKKLCTWDDLQLLRTFLFDPSFVNNQFTSDLFDFVFSKHSCVKTNKNQKMNKVFNEGIFINICSYLTSLQEVTRMARTCRVFYQYTFTKNLLCNVSYSAFLKLTDKEYKKILQTNINHDWYMFQLVKNYYNYSECNMNTNAISHHYLKHYGGYRYNINSTDVVCDKLSFIQPFDPEYDTLPVEWQHLQDKTRGKLKILIIENDTKNLMTKQPYHASIICWHKSDLTSSCFAKLGCYENVHFWIVDNSTMKYHVEVDAIRFGVSQLSNKKLYIFDTEGEQRWHMILLSFHNVEVYNYCVNQLVIQTIWNNIFGKSFWFVLDYLTQKKSKYGHCEIDINIFLFNTDIKSVEITKLRRLLDQIRQWISQHQKIIQSNKLIKSFTIGIKNYDKECTINVKEMTKDWSRHVRRVFGLTHRGFKLQASNNTVQTEWEKLLKLIYDEC